MIEVILYMTKTYFHILLCFFVCCSATANKNNLVLKAEILNENTTRIPFKLVGHLIVVEGELLGKQGDFIIDTGSERLILNSKHFPIKSNRKSKSGMSGVLGSIDNLARKKVDTFHLQNLMIENVNSDTIDLSHIEKSKNFRLLGIIGFNVLKNYEVFIDLYLNQITLSKVDKKGNKLDSRIFLEEIVDSVNFKLRKHTIVLNATIGSKKVKFGLDSGAEFNQLNKKVNKKVLQHFIGFRRMFVLGASDRKVEVLVGKLDNVSLKNSFSLMPMNTILINFDGMHNAYGVFLDGVLGYEFLRQKRTIINYKKEKLYFVDFPNE